MPDRSDDHPTGLYEGAVAKITEWVKPSLHKVSQDFIEKSVDRYAPDNERYARMIEFEIRRRGDGAGLTQDVAEPLLWTGIKTGVALGVGVLTNSIAHGKFKVIGWGAALGIMLNNAVEWLRVVPRYKAGLQGSLEMAKDRWKAIEDTGIDPFSSQTREINPRAAKHKRNQSPQSWQQRVSDLNVASGNDKSQHYLG